MNSKERLRKSAVLVVYHKRVSLLHCLVATQPFRDLDSQCIEQHLTRRYPLLFHFNMALCQRLFLFHLISSLAVGHSCLAFNEIFIVTSPIHFTALLLLLLLFHISNALILLQMNTSLIVNACQGVCDDTQV